MAKIQATMSTEIALDMLQASDSIKRITQLVNGATNAWKAQESQLRATGDYLGAAQAKYDGLGNAIQQQQSKIEKLQKEQSELKGNTAETAEQYLKYQQQIDQATTKLASMEAQQQKAKSSMEYYKSGLADLKKEYKQQADLSESYIKRLEAEGKEDEAKQEKLKLLKSSVINLNKQYEAQVDMLRKVSAQGNGDAYVKQKQRINETATALAKAKSEQEKFDDELRKSNPTFFEKLKAKARESANEMQSLTEKAERTNSVLGSFREKLSFGAVAGMAQNAIQGVISSLTGMIGEVTNTSDAIQKFQSTMGFAGKTKEETEEATKIFKKYADDTVYELEDITNTGAQLAANGIENYKELAISAGNLNAVAGGNADTFKSVAMVLTQTAGAGKLTTENWNQMADAIPGASGKLQEALKNAGAYTGDFRDAMSKGEISAEEFLKAIQELGSSDAAEKAARSTQTFEGSIGNLEATITTGMTNIIDAFGKENITGAITKFGDIAGKAFEKVADGVSWMNDNITVITMGPAGRFFNTTKAVFSEIFDAFKQNKDVIGDVVGNIGTVALNLSGSVWQIAADTVAGVSNGFESIKKNLKDSESPMNTFKSGLSKITDLSDKLFMYIYNHTGDIVQIVSSITEIAGLFSQGVWDVVSDSLKGISDAFSEISKHSKNAKDQISSLSKAIQGIAKHKGAIKAVGAMFATYFISTKVVAGFNAAGTAIKTMSGNIVTSLNAIKTAAMANPYLAIAIAITTIIAGFVELYKHNKKFRDFCDGIAKSVKDGIGSGIKWLKDKFDSMSKGWKKFKKSISNGTDNVVKSIKNGAKKVGNFFTSVGKTIKNVVTTIGKILIFANPVVLGFALMYKESAKFRKFVKGIVGFVGDLKDGISKKTKEIKKSWDKHWDKTKEKASKTWDGIKDNAKESTEKLAKTIREKHDEIHDKWSKTWKKSKNYLSNKWDEINDESKKKFGKDFKGLLFDNLDKIGNKFQEIWNAIRNGFSDMWNGLKDLAGNGINAVIKIPNDGIDGINSLIHDFGGPKNAIGKIPKVKFANGTGMFSSYRNPITRPTLATLNDGNDSPETNNQEMVIFPNGKAVLPQGKNVQMLLPAGAEVLNASELAMLAGLNNRQAFAKGTGFWSKIWNTATSVASSAWNGLKDGVDKFTKMLSFITDAVTDPSGTLAKKFSPNADKLDGVFSSLGNALYKKPIETAKNWWSELWSMAKEKASPEIQAGAIGDDYQFKDRVADSGADPWGYFFKECVSFVASRLSNQGVNASLFSGLGNGNMWLNARVPHSSTPKPGMIAVYAKNGQNHVSTVSGVSGSSFSGEEYNYAGSHAYHAFANRPISQVDTFLDFGVQVADKAKEENSPLRKLIKSQVGGMFDWISKILAPLNGSGGDGGEPLNNPQGGSVERWREYVIKALKANGLQATAHQVNSWMKLIQRESNGDPRAINLWDSNAKAGHPSKGLAQTIDSTFNAYKFTGHNDIYNGYDNLLAAINYMKHRYGTSDAAFTRVASYGYANGGLVSKNGVYELAEGNMPEYVIPTDVAKRGRAWQLLSEAVSRFAGEAPQDHSASGSSESSLAKLEAKFDTVISLLTQLVANGANPIELRNIIDGQSIANGLAPYMSTANTNYERRQALLGGEII